MKFETNGHIDLICIELIIVVKLEFFVLIKVIEFHVK